jgi:hypothetical protein
MGTTSKPKVPTLLSEATTLLDALRDRGFGVRLDDANHENPGLIVRPGNSPLTDHDRQRITFYKPYLLLLLAPERLLARVLADVAALYELRPAEAEAMEAAVLAVAGDVDALLTLHSSTLTALVEARHAAAGGPGDRAGVREVLAAIAGHDEMLEAA